MIRFYFVAVLLALTVVAGCQQKTYVHEADDYATLFPAGWRRTIGTDFVAGNNEYLYLNDLPMQWSADCAGKRIPVHDQAGQGRGRLAFRGPARSELDHTGAGRNKAYLYACVGSDIRDSGREADEILRQGLLQGERRSWRPGRVRPVTLGEYATDRSSGGVALPVWR